MRRRSDALELVALSVLYVAGMYLILQALRYAIG